MMFVSRAMLIVYTCHDVRVHVSRCSYACDVHVNRVHVSCWYPVFMQGACVLSIIIIMCFTQHTHWYGQGILFSISAISLINSTPRAIDYFNSWWCVIEQLHATRHPLDYILVTRACPHLFQRSTLRKLPNSSYRDQIFMHRRSIDLSSHMFARIARGVTGNRQHSQIKSNQMFLLAYMIYIILPKIYIL